MEAAINVTDCLWEVGMGIRMGDGGSTRLLFFILSHVKLLDLDYVYLKLL